MALFDVFRRTTSDADATTQPRRFGFAVVGLGHIADYFLEALRDSPTCTVAAVVSGSAEKAAAAAKRYRVPHALTYPDFESLSNLPAVDAVYLALPVSMHLAYTQRAAAAGKHILCEKPMASTAEEARAMIAACQAAGVRLSIAYRCPYTFAHQRAREILRSGVLGSDLRIESGFGFKLDPGWRTDGALAGGGSLFDVGIYPLNAARYLLGEEPTGVTDASAVCDGKGLEQSVQWTSSFPSGATARCRSSYVEHIPDTLRITGSTGTLLLDPAFGHREGLRLQGEYTDPATGRPVAVNEPTPKGAASHFRLEAEALASAVRGGVDTPTPGEDGLADMLAMEAIYAAAGVVRRR
ncbi:MAG: Gfo/Idh/MocA family protein [Janthinobacterium lividum]